MNEEELNVISGILHYLNTNVNNRSIMPDGMNLIDSNGEHVARIIYGDNQYFLTLLGH